MLIIAEKAHPTFKRAGNDLCLTHKLPLVDALCDSVLEVQPPFWQLYSLWFVTSAFDESGLVPQLLRQAPGWCLADSMSHTGNEAWQASCGV